MYDMYPWNDHADSGTAEPRYAHADPAAPATHAVQVALDRRDNGGDTKPGQPAAPPATLPTPGRTRQ